MDEQYILDLWKWTTSQDPTFTQRYTFDSWKNKLQDNSQYREDFHGWVSSVDPTFSKRRPLNDWSKLVSNQAVDIQSQVTGGIVKKKDDTRSVGQIIGDYQESLASGSEDGLSESPTITEVSDVSVTEEVPAQPEEQPITSSEVLGYDYTDPEVRNYVQSLGEGAETELRKIQKKKLLDQLQSNKTTEEKKEIADNLRLIDDLNLKEKGIINLANAPTVEEFLAGQETIADIDRGLISSLVQSGNDKAAKLLYNQQLKSIQDQQKKEAGFVEFNGEFYDPSDLPTGYGFNTALESVDFSTVAGRDEEAVANNLLSKFSQYGFDFQQSGILDNVTITSPLGNTLEVSVDNFTDAGDAESGRQIKRFLLTEYLAQELSPEQDVAKAMVSPADLSQVGMGTEFDYEDYYTEAGYDTRRASMIEEDSLAIRDLNEAIEAEGKIAEQAKQELMTLENALNKDPFNPKLRSQYESKRLQVEGLNLKIERQNKLRNKAVNNYNNILNEMNYSLGQRALNYVEWDISNLPELFLGEMSRGTAEMLSGYIDIAGDAANLYNFVHEGITGDKLFTDAELKEWKKNTKNPIKAAGELAVGAMFSGDLDPAEMLQDGSVTIKDGKLELGGERVSNQTVAEFNKQGWLAKGLTGTMRSAPAIMTGPLRLASFYAMGSESLNEQLNNIPELANLSETEKLKIKIPLGLGNAVLEEFGMRRVLQNSSFVSNLFLKSLRQFSKKPVAQQTARTFRETVVKNLGNSVGGKVAKTALLSASSGAAEYETGLLQEFLDVYGKEFYDLANESDYFKNVVTLQDEEGNFSLDNAANMEVLEAAHYAGLAEMVGGIVMGMPSAVTQASRSFGFNEISDGHFELFKQVSEVENVEDFLVQQRATLDASVGLVINEDTKKPLTQEEADTQMRNYEILIGIKNTIPAEFSPEYGKKILSLALQQKALQQEIKNLDKSASNEQQRRLKIIEEDIAELSRAAEKELAESTKEYEAQKKAGETDLTFKAWRFQEMMKKSVREATKKEEETEEAVEETGEAVEETAVTEEAPVTEQERAKIREILSEPAAQEQVVEEAPVVEQVTEEVVQETPVKEESIEEEELEFGENTFVYKMSRSRTPSGRGRWEADFEIIDNRPNEQGIRNDNTSDANWMVLNKITGEMLEATSKKDAQGIIKNAPAEAGIFGEGQQLDFTQLTPSQQKKFKKEFERQKATRSQDEVVEQVVEEAPVVEQVTEDVVEETPVKEESKKKVVVAPQVSKIEAEISNLESEIEDNSMRLEDAELEIDNEKYNYKEEVKRIKEEKAKVRVNKKLSKDAKRERLEELEAQREEFMENRDANIENYKDDASELRKEIRKAKNKIAKLKKKAQETPVKKEAPKIKTRKKKPLVKKEAQISEQVQKEIDRAERLRDRIVADKTNEKQRLRNSNLTRAQKIERKEKLESEIIQTEKRYNNIITELKEGKRTQFQVKETQETKTDDSRYEEFVSVLKRSFPSVEVVTTQAEFDTLLNKTGANQLITKDQSVYGAVYQGKLYLNPSLENYNTPIHEFGHIWMNVAKEANPKLYEKGIGLVKGSEYEQQVKNNPAYKDSTEQEILEEALATAIGDKGEAFVKESKRKSFKDWLTTLYGFVRKLTGISKYTANQLDDITLDEFTQAVAVDLLSGEQLFEGAEITDMGDALQLMTENANITPSMSAQNIINRARAAEIRDAVIVDYLMSEKELTRKQAVSAIKRANRGNLKDAVKRLFNNVEDITNIREKDAQLIKDILKFDRSITRADKIAQKKAKDEIKSRLKAIQRKSKGKLSQAQVLAVTNRFANVNLSSEKSIDSFVDYMQKVFSDVDYAAKMTSLNKSIKQAKKNIKSKIGRGADGLAYELRRLLNISPTIIPDSVLEEYSDLVTSFGERKTVLNLKDSAEVKETIAKIFEELSVQNSELSELSERFEAFEDKKFTKTGAVSFAKTVAQMLKDEVITEDEAKLMRKFKSEIMPIEKAEGKTEEEKQKELEKEKEILIKNIKKSSVNVEGIELAIEKALVKDFARLIKTNAINDLNNAQLKNIEKAIDNINNGYVTHYVQLASENLASINRSKTGAEGIRDAKPLAVSTQIAKIKTLFQEGSDANKFYKLIERNPLINIDMVLGDFSSKRIFNSVLEESAEAVTTFNTELNKVYNTINDAEIQLQKKFKYNGNNIIESKYKQMAYMIQKEFESNPNNSQVSPAAAVMEVTIKKLRDNNRKYEADILQKILKNYSTDGEIDLKKLDDSFVYAELNMIKTVQEINSKLTDKATYTASVIRGESIEPLNNYIHQSVLNADGVAVEDSRALSESYMENIRPSTRAKNLIERTKGAKAINFDITASVRRGAKMTLLDYHLTAPLRTANRTLNKMEEQLDDTGQQRQIFLGIRDAYNQAISDILENKFTSSGISEQIFQYVAKQGYRSMLASIPRLFGELISNYSFAIFNPVEFIEGNKPKNMRVAFGEKGVEVMNNVKSKETTRLYGEGLSGRFLEKGLSGRFVETSMTDKKMGMSADSAQNPVINRLNQSLSYIKKYPRGVDAIADAMITTPDKLVTRPMWFGTFATEFKNITGQEVNFDKIAANDTEYMAKYEKAINEAKKKADSNSVLIGATDNPLQGILKNRKRASDGNFASAIKTVNTFMQRFLLFEYNAFRKGMYAAIGRGDISKAQGAALMTAVTARMTMYTIMVPLINSIIFGDADDDEEKESTYTRVYRAFVSTATNLFIGRGFGNIVKMAQNYFIEWANEEHGEDLGIREGKYNPYENSVQYNVVPPKKPYKETDVLSDIFPNLLGAYSPFVKSIVFGINKFAAKEKKEKAAKERQRREIKERLPLEIGGLTGFIPFYRDIRKSLMDDIYKDLRNKKKKKKKKKEIKYIR